MKIAICDDSQHDIYLINKYVHEYMVANYLDIELYSFQSGAELLTSIKATPFDIVFLDIFLGNSNGIDIAHAIRNLKYPCLLIFQTSSRDYAIEGFELNALHYIIKPLNYNQVKEALDRCCKHITEDSKYIEVTSNRVKTRIKLKELIYAEVYGNITLLHTTNNQVKTYTPLDELEDQVKSSAFFRCHRSFLINMEHVKKTDNNNFVFKNGGIAPISRQNKHKAMQTYTNYLFNAVREGIL